MTQVVDTEGRTIAGSYDNLDRLISETTPQGSISYSYDAAGRRTTMQVAGQAVCELQLRQCQPPHADRPGQFHDHLWL